MASENETVEGIVKEMLDMFPPKYCSSKHRQYEVDVPVRSFARRIESARRREKDEVSKFAKEMQTWFRLYFSCNGNPVKSGAGGCGSCRLERCPYRKWRNVIEGGAI